MFFDIPVKFITFLSVWSGPVSIVDIVCKFLDFVLCLLWLLCTMTCKKHNCMWNLQLHPFIIPTDFLAIDSPKLSIVDTVKKQINLILNCACFSCHLVYKPSAFVSCQFLFKNHDSEIFQILNSNLFLI